MPKESIDLIVRNGTVVTLNSDREIIEDGAVAIKGNRIVDVGPDAKVSEKYAASQEIDAKGMAVLPGFINAHTHATHNLLRGGLSQDRILYDWLQNVLYAGLAQYTGEDARTAATLYCIESIRGGITTSVDNADFGMRDELSENTIEMYIKHGIRGIYARMFSDNEPGGEEGLMEALAMKEPRLNHAENYIEDTDEALASMRRLMKKYHGAAGGRISVWPSPGIPLFLTPEGMLGALKLAEEFDTMLSTHLAESQADAKTFGISTTQYLAYIGYLNSRILAGHCVWMDDRDLRILKMYDVKVANLAVSNQFLASGLAPIAKMINLGITVGIGTDDTNCNDSVNMLSDMKHVALLQKVANLDAGAITSETVLEMATIEGAKAVGMEKDLGSIENGKIADIITIDMNKPHLKPCHHIPSVLVYQANGSEVDTTIIDGKVLMTGGKLTLISEKEENEVMEKAQIASRRIAEEAGMDMERGWKKFNL